MNKIVNFAWPMLTAWIIAFFAVIMITMHFQVEVEYFYGIADSREIVVNSEIPVEIKRVNVLEGQSIREGQLLVELNNPELALKINEISHQFEQLNLQNGLDKAQLASEIAQLEAEKLSKTTEITNQIKQLESQYQLNKVMTGELKSIEKDTLAGSRTVSPIKLRIDSLQRELQAALKPLCIRIELLQNALNASDSPQEIQGERLQKELEMLKKENNRLNIYARISGVIGSINYKPGEKAPPFSPILTLHAQTPTFIKGYIYENEYSRVSLGDTMQVAAMTDRKETVQGTVVGVGSRIVEYPVRLRKHPDFQVWGREVVIRISEKNPFILGEKVMISKKNTQSSVLAWIPAWLLTEKIRATQNHENTPPESEMKDTLEPVVPFNISGIEASGVIYLPAWKQYVVISDETPDHEPVLFLMLPDGRISGEKKVAGLDKISDVEGIALGDEDAFYLVCSLSPDKRGKRSSKRQQLVKVKVDGSECRAMNSVDLYVLLTACAEENPEQPWAGFILNGARTDTLDIEGMCLMGKDMLLAFKSPLEDGNAVILKLQDVDEMLAEDELHGYQVAVWRRIRLSDKGTASGERISDIYFRGDDLFLTSVGEKKKHHDRNGSVWRFHVTTGKLTCLATYNDFQPEGIHGIPDSGDLVVVFDQGPENQSFFTTIVCRP